MSREKGVSGWTLSHDRCPLHGYEAISFQEKGAGGQRLTHSKCCGRWESLKRWRVDPWDLVVDIVSEVRSLVQEQSFDLRDRIEAMIPTRNEEFERPPLSRAPEPRSR